MHHHHHHHHPDLGTGSENLYFQGAMADDAIPHTDVLNSTAQGQLKSIIERVERLEVEKAEIMEQIKEVYAEAKGNGFDVKVLKKVVRIRKQDRAKRQEEDAILDLYLSAIGEI
nr:Chain A, UPF0335 protein CC_3319 [Caulobacter vibrioides CB15]6OZY_A Chain A, UPF0335 protein CC_3319 [Caulobacter vibrioides CB15]6OZY_B Chain B, UPF0335 protein CC_3319 [Caulobacter vibrioides CB15]